MDAKLWVFFKEICMEMQKLTTVKETIRSKAIANLIMLIYVFLALGLSFSNYRISFLHLCSVYGKNMPAIYRTKNTTVSEKCLHLFHLRQNTHLIPNNSDFIT